MGKGDSDSNRRTASAATERRGKFPGSHRRQRIVLATGGRDFAPQPRRPRPDCLAAFRPAAQRTSPRQALRYTIHAARRCATRGLSWWTDFPPEKVFVLDTLAP